MARLDDSTLAALLLTSRLITDGPPPLKAREFWALVAAVGGDPAVLLAGDAPAVADPERIRGLLGRATTFAFALEDVERSGINIVSAFDPRYPVRLRERLGDQAPPALHTVGPVALLSEPALAIVGSGDDPGALATAGECAVVATTGGRIVITGGSSGGVDASATTAALGANGRVVTLLADSLTRRIRHPDVRRAIHEGRLCLATPYQPDAPYTEVADAGRAKLLYALADLTLVVRADEGDPWWRATTDALEHGHGPVSVWRGSGQRPGNERLEDVGATPVSDLTALATLLVQIDGRAPTRRYD